MKIAVTYENGNVFQHFGHTGQFKLYEVSDGKVVSSEVVDTNGSGHGALAGFLANRGVQAPVSYTHLDVYKRQDRVGPGGEPHIHDRPRGHRL